MANESNLSPVTAAPAPLLGVPGMGPPQREIRVYSHSNLFYWWPVWLLSFILAGLTWIGNLHMAVVPEKTVAVKDRQVEVEPGKLETRHVFILPEKADLVERRRPDGDMEIFQPTIFISPRRTYGSLFVIVLLIVIGITNVPMRGLWSVFVLMVFVGLSIIFAVAGWWETIFAHLALLSIHINLGGYLLIGGVLFLLWLVNFFMFDRQIYMVFAPGQVRVRLEIGGGETVYDTTGMVVQKHRGDLFRHWVLGFGSGDLDIRPVGLANPIELPNVLAIGRTVKAIENLIKEKVVYTKGTEKNPKA